MPASRKILFSLIVFALVFGIVEAVSPVAARDLTTKNVFYGIAPSPRAGAAGRPLASPGLPDSQQARRNVSPAPSSPPIARKEPAREAGAALQVEPRER